MSNSNLVKIAVTLSDLRRAYKAEVSPHLVRSTRSARKKIRGLRTLNRGTLVGDSIGSAELQQLANAGSKKQLKEYIGNMSGVATLARMQVEQLRDLGAKETPNKRLEQVFGGKYLRGANERVLDRAKKTKKDGFILVGGDTGRGLSELGNLMGVSVPKAKTSEGREAINRLIGLHEKLELKSYKKAYSRGPQPTFFSHQGPQPMLSDIIIANTFKGKGGDEVRAAIKGLRGKELDSLQILLQSDPKASALIEKLQSGGRINRHQRKYLDRLYATKVLNRT